MSASPAAPQGILGLFSVHADRVLRAFAFGVLINAAITAIVGDLEFGALGYAPAFLFLLLTVLPWFALMVRRLHDIGVSGWFVLLYFVPGFNTLGVLALGLIPSKVGENPWGPVPAGVRI